MEIIIKYNDNARHLLSNNQQSLDLDQYKQIEQQNLALQYSEIIEELQQQAIQNYLSNEE